MSDIERRVARSIGFILMTAVLFRVAGAVTAGFGAIAHAPTGVPFDSARTSEVLTAFGSAGDTVSALVLLTALAVTAGECRSAGAAWAATPTFALQALFALTLVGAVLRVTGVAVGTSDVGGSIWDSAVPAGLYGAGDVIICAAGLAAVTRLSRGADAADTPQAILFAVDRVDGEVFAFFSYADAARTLNVYSIEDNEFAFYADDGTFIIADVADGRPSFSDSGVNRRDELLSHLRAFAVAHALDVDPEDRDDPTAYALPISEWQELELWPPWLRPIGRLVRRARGL